MRDDSFCARPGQCPVQHKCARNVETWGMPPPIRIYEAFHWVENSGCDGFKNLSMNLTGQQILQHHSIG